MLSLTWYRGLVHSCTLWNKMMPGDFSSSHRTCLPLDRCYAGHGHVCWEWASSAEGLYSHLRVCPAVPLRASPSEWLRNCLLNMIVLEHIVYIRVSLHCILNDYCMLACHAFQVSGGDKYELNSPTTLKLVTMCHLGSRTHKIEIGHLKLVMLCHLDSRTRKIEIWHPNLLSCVI
jgi:hypothetical protein